MDRLGKYAPGIRRMLTEEPVEPLFGAVDLWCPISPSYNHEAAEKRREKGEHFWWYVCTGPKAPYCTLFIDHPATDLCVWLWQAWQRKIDGILVWQSTHPCPQPGLLPLALEIGQREFLAELTLSVTAGSSVTKGRPTSGR